MAQEVKPIDNSLFGNNRSWRDEARYRLTQSLGQKYGELLGEGLLGESEEDKYLDYLQRTYGSTLPRDEQGNISEEVPLNRPMGEAFKDMSDLGALDQTLMTLSGGSSLFPKVAATAAGVETGALLGDAEGELRKGNPLGAGIMGVTAALPYGINRVFRGSRETPAETPVKSSREIDKTQEAPSEKLTLYHGSGQDFDKFDIEKAGEGDLGYGLYFTPDKNASNIYTNPSSSKIKSMYSAKSVDEVIERRGGDPNPTVYKTEVDLSTDEIYNASKYNDQSPVMQSKIDNIINDFDLPPINKTKTRGWRDLMDNLEEVGQVPEKVFSDYGIKAMKRDLTFSKLSGENTGKIYYSVFDDSLLDIVAKNDVPVPVKTPLLADPSRRQFTKGMGAGIATLGVMTSPLAPLLRRTGSTMAKLNPTKFLSKQRQVYDAIQNDSNLLESTDFNNLLPESFPDKSFSPKINKTGENAFEVNANYGKDFDNYLEGNKIQNKIQLDFFEENGLAKKDLLNIEDDGARYALGEQEIDIEFDVRNADPGSVKTYKILNEGKDTGDYVETFKIDGVPVVEYGNSSSMGHYTLTTIPKRESLLKIAK